MDDDGGRRCRSRSRSHRHNRRSSNAPQARSRSLDNGIPSLSPVKRALDPKRIADPPPVRSCSPDVDGSPSPGGGEQSRQSPSPASSGAAASDPPKPDLLNTAALEDIFARFHGKLDEWMEHEKSQIQKVETSGEESRDTLMESSSKVHSFLKEYVPKAAALCEHEGKGDGLVSRLLPQLVSTIEDDQRVLNDMTTILVGIAEKKGLSKGDDLESLKTESTPVPLLRALLKSNVPKKSLRDHRDAKVRDAKEGRDAKDHRDARRSDPAEGDHGRRRRRHRERDHRDPPVRGAVPSRN